MCGFKSHLRYHSRKSRTSQQGAFFYAPAMAFDGNGGLRVAMAWHNKNGNERRMVCCDIPRGFACCWYGPDETTHNKSHKETGYGKCNAKNEKSIAGLIKIDEKEIGDHLNQLVRQSEENTINSLPDAD